MAAEATGAGRLVKRKTPPKQKELGRGTIKIFALAGIYTSRRKILVSTISIH
jgi:hypothetical protein